MRILLTLLFSLIIASSVRASKGDTTKNLCIGIVAFGKISKKEIKTISESVAAYYQVKTVYLGKNKFPKNDTAFISDTIISYDIAISIIIFDKVSIL